jgi:hypothetical protein
MRKRLKKQGFAPGVLGIRVASVLVTPTTSAPASRIAAIIHSRPITVAPIRPSEPSPSLRPPCPRFGYLS